MSARPIAAAVDLGSSVLKGALLDEHGSLFAVRSAASPPLCGEGGRREGDAAAYLAAARTLIEELAALVPRGTPLGLATQRSSFTLFERCTGRARAPLVSWQDRRAAAWCERHRALEHQVARRTGLLLSAHYVGPKLAAMQEESQALAAELRSGELLLGTLESFVLWHASAGGVHESDLTVAARTALVDLESGSWSPELLELFGVPREVLPHVVATAGREVPLDCGLTLAVSVSDQAAAALPVLDPASRAALVNLGTGAFVLVPVEGPGKRKAGYLTAPILAHASECRYVLEGSVNGAGAAVDRFGPGPTAIPERDPAPGAFAVPDLAGLGAPWWRPEIGLTLSPAAERQDTAGRRRVVLEGLLFRLAFVLDDLAGEHPPERVLVAGGLARDPGVAPALAALLGRPVERVEVVEAGLVGAARLAAGLEPWAELQTTTIEPGASGAYLKGKRAAWRAWLEALLSGAGSDQVSSAP